MTVLGGLIHKDGLVKLGGGSVSGTLFGDLVNESSHLISGGDVFYSLQNSLETPTIISGQWGVCSGVTFKKISANITTNSRNYSGNLTFDFIGNTIGNDENSASLGDMGIAIPAITTGNFKGGSDVVFAFDFNDDNGWCRFNTNNLGSSGTLEGMLYVRVLLQ